MTETTVQQRIDGFGGLLLEIDVDPGDSDLDVARKTIELGSRLASWPSLLEEPLTAYVRNWRAARRRQLADEDRRRRRQLIEKAEARADGAEETTPGETGPTTRPGAGAGQRSRPKPGSHRERLLPSEPQLFVNAHIGNVAYSRVTVGQIKLNLAYHEELIRGWNAKTVEARQRITYLQEILADCGDAADTDLVIDHGVNLSDKLGRRID